MKNFAIGLFVLLVIIALFSMDFGDEVERLDFCEDAKEKYGAEYPDYADQLCLGEEFFADEEYNLAQRSYDAAAQVRFENEPNFHTYVRVAELKCTVGERRVGMTILGDYECALDVQAGERSCFTTVNGETKVDPTLPRGCAIWMCGEIYLPGYENPTPETLAKIADMRTELEHVRQFCVDGDTPD